MELNPVSELQLDKNGHLQDYMQWSQSIGEHMAAQDGIALTQEHWQIINLVRDIYLQSKTTPPMRLLIKAIKTKLSADIANSRHLYRLFPDGPVRLACKYGGLSKPKHCL